MMKNTNIVMRKWRLAPGPALCVLATLAAAAACTEKGEGLVVVNLASTQSIARATVVVAAPTDGSILGMGTKDWTQPLQMGVYVPKSVSGTVDIVACGFDSVGNLVASSPNDRGTYTTNVQPGAVSATVAITLVPGANPALCASIAGTGGAGGSMGLGGMATGGSAGGNASGGINGSGGTNGSGGAAGTPGTGGTAGASGKGGAGGAPGTGGTAGSGGAKGGAGGGGAAGSGMAGAVGSNGMWRGANAVANDAAHNEYAPAVAVDKNGNAVVVYERDTQIWGAYYDASMNKWKTPLAIDSRGGQGSSPQVVVDGNGQFLAVWNQDTTYMGIWQSTWDASKTMWAPPTSITQTNAYSPVISMNPSGQAVVAWYEQPSGTNNEQTVAAIRKPSDGSWTTKLMKAAADYSDRDPAVAIDGKGNAFVSWLESNTATYNSEVWMRQYTVGGAGDGWNAGGALETSPDGNTYDARLSANAGGDAIMSFIQITGGNPRSVQLWTHRYSSVMSKWATYPLMVTSGYYIDTYSYAPPAVTLDDAGIATVAWAAKTSVGYNVYTNQTASTDAAWPTTAFAMESNDTANQDDPNSTISYATMPLLAHDPAGNVTCVWRKRTTTSGFRFDLVARTFSGGTWGDQVLLGSDGTNSVFFPALAVGANGTAVATWYYANVLDVWANVFN
jgi:hypothetical protein